MQLLYVVAQKFLEAYRKYAPEIYSTLMEIKRLMDEGNQEKEISDLYAGMQKISIDYAITEKWIPRRF